MSTLELHQFADFFQGLKINGSLNRLGKLFHTKDNGYIYDLGTGKILLCNPEEYEVLNKIFEDEGLENIFSLDMDKNRLLACLENLKKVIEKEQLLQAPPLKEFSSLHSDFEGVKQQIENNLQQMTLELTEKCNLRCKYCIYSEGNESHRDFDTHDMTWDIAQKAIDYGINHSGEHLAVTFYGGEPLLQFELLKKCVEYTKKVAGNKRISHSMTTNLVLMTKEIAEYLASIERFSVVCSLDGPKEVHDENRVAVSGKGSFDNAIRGLKYLVEAYGERAATHLSLSMVMTLPATEEKLQSIQKFFEEQEWLPKKLVKNISYVSSSSHRSERLLKKSRSINGEKTVYANPVADWTQENTVFSKKVKPEHIYTNSFMESAYLRIHKRMIVDDPVGCYNLSGCCVPASRRLYVTATGNFSLCEKIGNAPYIGHVENGIDVESIRKNYIDNYVEEAKKICANCWAIRFCGNCYVDCYDSDGFRSEFKQDRCGATLYGTENALVAYHEMLERNPEYLEYLNNIELS